MLKNVMGGGKTSVKSKGYRNVAISLCLICFMAFTVFVSSVSVSAKNTPAKSHRKAGVEKSSGKNSGNSSGTSVKRAAASGASPKRAAASGASAKRAASSGASSKRAATSARKVSSARIMSRTAKKVDDNAEEKEEAKAEETKVEEVQEEVKTPEELAKEKLAAKLEGLNACPVEKVISKKRDKEGDMLYYTMEGTEEVFCDSKRMDATTDLFEWTEEKDAEKYPRGSFSDSDDLYYLKCKDGYISKTLTGGAKECVLVCPLDIAVRRSVIVNSDPETGKDTKENVYTIPDTGATCTIPTNATGRAVKSGENTRGDLDDKDAYMLECNANKYSAKVEGFTSELHYQCLACPVGYVSPAGSKSEKDCKIKCTEGQITNADGSCTTCDGDATVVNNACICKDGYYGAGYGDEGCQKCPDGYVCTGGEKKSQYATEEPVTEQKSCPSDAKPSADGTSCECKDSKYTFDAVSNTCKLTSCDAGKVLRDGKCVEECKAGSYRDSSGSCKECAFGTYTTKAEQTSCKKCSLPYLCPTTSTNVLFSRCKKNKFKVIDTAGNGSGTLPKGIYTIEVAGAGAGGGGGIKLCGACSTGKYDSGKGGNGDLKNSSFSVYVADSLSYTYTVGAGGKGSDRASCSSDGKYGADGGRSEFSSSQVTLIAEGGKGGRSVYGKSVSCHSGNNGSDAGNGQGGKGGAKRNGGNDSGNAGANGWVTIYQYICPES